MSLRMWVRSYLCVQWEKRNKNGPNYYTIYGNWVLTHSAPKHSADIVHNFISFQLSWKLSFFSLYNRDDLPWWHFYGEIFIKVRPLKRWFFQSQVRFSLVSILNVSFCLLLQNNGNLFNFTASSDNPKCLLQEMVIAKWYKIQHKVT